MFPPCGGGPPPTPTPSPSATPTPTPTPCPSPFSCIDPAAAFPADFWTWPTIADGCPPVTYERRGNCCYLVACPSPSPVRPADCVVLISPPTINTNCQWICLSEPPPTQEGCEAVGWYWSLVSDSCQQDPPPPCYDLPEICDGGSWSFDWCVCWYYSSPIVVDVAGNGFDLTSAANGVSINLNNMVAQK